MSRLPKNRIPIEKFTSEEIDLGENLDETLIELVGANDINWFLTEDEKLIVKESAEPNYNFSGMPSHERNSVLHQMKVGHQSYEPSFKLITQENCENCKSKLKIDYYGDMNQCDDCDLYFCDDCYFVNGYFEHYQCYDKCKLCVEKQHIKSEVTV